MSDAELHERVLWALPLAQPDAAWLLATQVADQLEAPLRAVADALERLDTGQLVVHDDGWPRRWARRGQGAPDPARLPTS